MSPVGVETNVLRCAIEGHIPDVGEQTVIFEAVVHTYAGRVLHSPKGMRSCYVSPGVSYTMEL